MKKLFDKDNFIFFDMNKEQKKQSLILSIFLIVAFIIASFIFLYAFYGFVDCIGSIVSGSMDVAISDLLRNLPIILCSFMSIWVVLLLQASFRKVNDEKWFKSLFKNAIALIAFAVVNIIYIIVGLAIGKYTSLVEGSPSRIYPLDAFMFSFIIIALGLFVILYVKKYHEKLQYLAPKHGEIVTKARGLYCTFVSFWMLFAMFGLSAGLYSIFIYDFMHEHVFFGIAVILVYLLSPCMLAMWEFFYNEIKEEKKKELLLPLSLISLGVSVLFAVLYIVSLSLNKDAPSNAGFGMFPVAFAASVNIATLLMVFTPVIVSIVALIKGILLKKKAA